MMTQPQKRRLGRGLAALIGDDTTEDAVMEDARSLRHLPIEFLHANPNNPRKHFADSDLEDLTRSIRDKGLLQPLVVRQRNNGEYEIVAGERRWRAAQRAGIHEVPVLVRNLTDGEALEIALIENIQRADLNALEEARAYQQLMDQFSYTQQQLADSVGKSRSHVANTIRLLSLPESVRRHIEDGALTAGHARALVATDSPHELAEKIIELGMTVREAEGLTRSEAEAKGKPAAAKAHKDTDTLALEKQIGEVLGLKVEIVNKGRAGGTLTVRYKSLEQLDDVCNRLVRTS
ncbi:ParB/RepB/Spo0J family partition protein [Nordella sp. HKS 07]|nr:ParB/RepB/Spo0J family partition protein [Nordella sp. HKS 07]QIG52428.1 ParB/RepB/Spo0J family partition protein [Nordella sp. HKS 07]